MAGIKMTKDQFENLLRSTGCDENSIRFGVNAFEMGVEHEREACAKICEEIYTGEEACGDWPTPEMCANAIRARGQE